MELEMLSGVINVSRAASDCTGSNLYKTQSRYPDYGAVGFANPAAATTP